MNDFLVAETYSYALFNGIFFTRWVETTALIMAFYSRYCPKAC